MNASSGKTPAVQEPRVSDDEAAPLVMSDSLFATLGKMIHILENCQGGTFDKGTKPIDLNRVMDDLRLASALLRNMHTKLGNARATIASQAEALAATKAENARLNIELDLALKAVMENQAALKAARDAGERFADRVDKLAFQMRAPNVYTPIFLELVLAYRAALTPKEPTP